MDSFVPVNPLDVAIKIIKPGILSEQLTSRLATERQILAGMNHPNIARLFDGGSLPDGAPYIVMELIDGQPSDLWAATTNAGKEQRVELVITAARAVAYAHQRLVIHRDITPANVLVASDGTVKLIDFGIARTADDTTTTATDVFGLSRLLDHLLTVPDQMWADQELAAIIAKAQTRDPNMSYVSVDAMSEDLIAWRDGKPVLAMGDGAAYLLGKFVRRYRWPVGAAIFVFALLASALTAVLFANEQARMAEVRAINRFQETRSVAQALLFPVFDEVARVSGSTKAKAELAQTGLTYLEKLAAMPEAPHDVRVEAGRGFVRLAEVTGGGQAGQLGRFEDSAKLLARAEGLLVPAFAERPDDRDTALAYATLRLEQAGTNLYNYNRPDAARTQAEAAKGAVSSWVGRDAEATAAAISALQAIGDSYGWNDDYATAFPYHQMAEKMVAALPAAMQLNERVMMARSSNLRLLAESAHKTGRANVARLTVDAAIKINRDLLANEPDDPARLRKLTTSLWYAAVVHRTNNRQQSAERCIEEAVTIARRMTARDEADAGALQMLAITLEVKAQIHADRGDSELNSIFGSEMLEAHDRLVKLAGNASGALRSRAAALRTQRTNRWNVKDPANACKHWRAALGTYENLKAIGELSKLDAHNALPEISGLVRSLCGSSRPQWRPVVI